MRGKHAAVPSLSDDMRRVLANSMWGGRRGLLSAVIDQVRAHPYLRDGVVADATLLNPYLGREFARAADLAVLTAGRNLTLAPVAAQALPKGGAASAGNFQVGSALAAASAASAAPRAVPPSPPSAADQTWQLTIMKADVAQTRGWTGNGITVAVGDTGFDTTNDALRNRLDLTRAKNYIINTPGTAFDATDVGIQAAADTHGSHVAGIIAAEQIAGMDMRGVANNARVIPIRVILGGKDAPQATYASQYDGPGAMADLLDYYASLNNVRIFNASYGPSVSATPTLRTWELTQLDVAQIEPAKRALAAGKIIVAANGNDRTEHPIAALNPSGLALYPFVNPANLSSGAYTDNGANADWSSLLRQPGMIIGVMSVDQLKRPAAFSNLCGVTASWCVAGPGGDYSVGSLQVYSTVPDNTYTALAGTSMAAPAVSGALAVLMERHPTYTAREIARLLFSTTEDLGAPGIDSVFGHGLPDLDRATANVTAPNAGDTVTVAANTTTYWAPAVTAGGSFTKDGGGVLTISGRTSVPGTVTVNLGTLAVDGTLTGTGGGNVIDVASNGMLAGFGEINGHTRISGILSPGKMPNVADVIANGGSMAGVTSNSPGTLTFYGNVVLTTTATTRIKVDGTYDVPGGPGSYDKIVISGSGYVFNASGTLTPVLRGIAGGYNSFTPSIGTVMKFVDAQNGASTTGAFSSITQPSSGLASNSRFHVIYSPISIALSVTPASFTAMGGSGNAQSIGALLDRLRPASGAAPTGSTKVLFDALYSLTSAQSYSTAMTQLSGSGQPANTSSLVSNFSGFMGTIADRQSALQGGVASVQGAFAPDTALAYADGSLSAEARGAMKAMAYAGLDQGPTPATEGWAIWGQAFGRWSHIGEQNGNPGSLSRSGGFTLGADRLLAADLIGGIAFGFTRTTTDTNDARATSDSYSGALYTSWTPAAWVIDLRAAVGPTSTSTTRSTILTPSIITGKSNGFGGNIVGEVGYRIPVGAFTVKPLAGLTWQTFKRNGYSETTQPFGLTYPAQTFTKLTSTLGVATSTRTKVEGITLMPELRLAWLHDLRDETLTSQASLLDSSFTATAASPGRDAAQLGLSLTAWTRQNLRVFGSYVAELRSNAQSQQIAGGLRYSW